MESRAMTETRHLSPPAREAWIEIRARGTDTNRRRSPPAREAWIEMPPRGARVTRPAVASREGGVD